MHRISSDWGNLAVNGTRAALPDASVMPYPSRYSVIADQGVRFFDLRLSHQTCGQMDTLCANQATSPLRIRARSLIRQNFSKSLVRASITSKFRARSSAISSRPIRTLIAISQADAALTEHRSYFWILQASRGCRRERNLRLTTTARRVCRAIDACATIPNHSIHPQAAVRRSRVRDIITFQGPWLSCPPSEFVSAPVAQWAQRPASDYDFFPPARFCDQL